MTIDDHADLAPPAGEKKPKPAAGRSGPTVKVPGKPAAPVHPKRVQKIIHHIDNIKPPFIAADVAQRLDLWRLNDKTGTYFHPLRSGADWGICSEKDLRRFLKSHGVHTKEDTRDSLCQADEIFEYVRNHRVVGFAGPLAGYSSGVHKAMTGEPMVVFGGPRMIAPVKGDSSLIWEILKPRFEDEAGPQLDYFLSWLLQAARPLYKKLRRKGLILILVGARNAGKNFIQDHIISPILGGRDGDPTSFFKSEAGFNKNLMACEHWKVQEFEFPTDAPSRRMLSEKFKKIAANDGQTYHPKGLDAMTVHPQLRLSISLNDAEDKLSALPAMGDDFTDKVLLLRLQPGLAMPMPTNYPEEEAAFAAAVKAALPAFVHDLLEWTPPEGMEMGRFGMPAWQHPFILESLWSMDPARRFAFLLDLALFPEKESKATEWQSAAQLHESLTVEGASHHRQFNAICRTLATFEQLLGSVHRHETKDLSLRSGVPEKNIKRDDLAHRYAWRHTNRGNEWKIRPPTA